MPERSEGNAKEATQSFAKEKLAPFANHTNPESKPGVTFAAQDKLPKLPIPDLEATCRKYLAAVDPLQTAREHADSERAVADFLRSDGPELQEKLKQYATGKSSYIEQFCKRHYHSLYGIDADRVIKGTTPISTTTTQSCSISTRSSCSKMTLPRLGTTKLLGLHRLSSLPCPLSEPYGKKSCRLTRFAVSLWICTSTPAYSVLPEYPPRTAARSARTRELSTSSCWTEGSSTGSMLWTTTTT